MFARRSMVVLRNEMVSFDMQRSEMAPTHKLSMSWLRAVAIPLYPAGPMLSSNPFFLHRAK